MKISAVHLRVFGGITDLEVEFQPGLNIVLGDNESGKSTLFRAIQHTLLTSARSAESWTRSFRNRTGTLRNVRYRSRVLSPSVADGVPMRRKRPRRRTGRSFAVRMRSTGPLINSCP